MKDNSTSHRNKVHRRLGLTCLRSLPAVLAAILAYIGPASAAAQIHDGQELVRTGLHADTEVVAPGRPFTVALHMKIAEGWHTYWEYSGEAGMPTILEWDLPAGFRAGPVQWPLPFKILEAGEVEVFAYKDEVVLFTRIFPPAGLPDDEVSLHLSASWLVCEYTCIPGSAERTLTLQTGRNPQPVEHPFIEGFRKQVPGAPASDQVQGWTWSRDGETLVLEVEHSLEADEYDFYPLPDSGVVLDRAKVIGQDAGKLRIEVPVVFASVGLLAVDGVLVAEDSANGSRKGFRLRP